MSKRAWLYWMIPISILGLQVVKVVLKVRNLPHAYFWGSLAGALQFLVLLIAAIFLLARVFSRLSDRQLLLRTGIAVMLLLVFGEALFMKWLQAPALIPRFFQSSFIFYNDHYNTKLLQYQREGSLYDSGLFYTLQPDTGFEFNNAEFHTRYQTNSAGLRDDAASLEYPEVICLGDSYTMGWGVEQEESFPQQLEKKLGKKVLNAGISSYGTARELLLLKRLKLDSLKYLVIQYCDNDYGENKTFLENQGKLPISSRTVYDSLVTEQEWNTRYYPGKHFLQTAPLILKKTVNLIYPVFDLSQQRNQMEKKPTNPITTFYQVLGKALPKDRKFTVIVLYMDGPGQVAAGSAALANAPLAVKAAIDSSGQEIIPFQYGELNPQTDYYRLDLHLTAAGNRNMADWLFQAITNHQQLRQ